MTPRDLPQRIGSVRNACVRIRHRTTGQSMGPEAAHADAGET